MTGSFWAVNSTHAELWARPANPSFLSLHWTGLQRTLMPARPLLSCILRADMLKRTSVMQLPSSTRPAALITLRFTTVTATWIPVSTIPRSAAMTICRMPNLSTMPRWATSSRWTSLTAKVLISCSTAVPMASSIMQTISLTLTSTSEHLIQTSISLMSSRQLRLTASFTSSRSATWSAASIPTSSMQVSQG